MNSRINFENVHPEGYKQMLTFSRAAKPQTLSTVETELIKIRASQINGCAFCLDLHTRLARRAGETEGRIHVLAAWRDTSFFTEQEKAMLALTEEITLIHQPVSDQTYLAAAQVLSELQIAEVILTIVVINSWNRIMKATRFPPPLDL